MCLFSVIIVTYNASSSLENTLLSLINQKFKNFEIILVDGLSKDDTMVLVEKYKYIFSKIISEPDNGIYDAMNKGIRAANGQYLFFLGADDILASHDTLEKVSCLLEGNNLDLLAGSVKYNTGRNFESKFGLKILLNNTIHHQGAFYNYNLFKTFAYDTDFKLIADYELNLRLYKNRRQLRYKFTSEVISICAEGGASRSLLNTARIETNKVRLKVLGKYSLLLNWIYNLKFRLTYVI